MMYRRPGVHAVVFFAPAPPSPVSKLSLSSLLAGEGAEGVGEELNHTTARKLGSL
jgi:hypothetical protein